MGGRAINLKLEKQERRSIWIWKQVYDNMVENLKCPFFFFEMSFLIFNTRDLLPTISAYSNIDTNLFDFQQNATRNTLSNIIIFMTQGPHSPCHLFHSLVSIVEIKAKSPRGVVRSLIPEGLTLPYKIQF